MSEQTLEGKRILVTGGTSGIGRSIVLHCAAAGADVAFCGLPQDDVAETLDEVRDIGNEVYFEAFDLTELDKTRSFVQSANQALGGLDGVVSNAGANFFNGLVGAQYSDVLKCFQVNFFPAWAIFQEAHQALIASGNGKFISVTSIHGTMSLPGSFPYDVSKAAVNALIRSITLEFSSQGIQAISVAPSLMKTPLADKSFAEADDPEAEWEKYRQLHPVKRIGRPEDVASLVRYLFSDENRYITGNTIYVDGGLHVQIG